MHSPTMRNAWTRLTFEDLNEKPIWSSNGKRVIFTSNRVDGVYQVFSKSADGSGRAEQLTKGTTTRVPTSLSPDGTSLVVRLRGDDGSWDLGVVHLDGERDQSILLATPFDEHSGMISPDGRWLVYTSNESGRDEIYVTSFPEVEGKWPLSTEGGTEPMWSPNGKEIFYRNGGMMMAVSVTTEPNFISGKPSLLFEGDYSADLDFPSANYDVTADGQQFLMIRPEGSSSQTLNVILNWFDELERLVPTDVP